MSTRKIASIIVLAFMLLAAWATYRQRPVTRSIRLDLTGTPGLKVAGSYSVDGVAQDFAGVLPTNITVAARSFDYTIHMLEPKGQLHGQLAIDGGPYGSSAAADDRSGVRGSYSHTWSGKTAMFTTVSGREK